jgi:multisubunit Na+/H+ antiporter MnhC subunit
MNMVSQIILDFFVAVFVVYEQQGVMDVVDLGLSYDGVTLLYLGIQKQRNGRLFEKPRDKCGDFFSEHFFERPFENAVI